MNKAYYLDTCIWLNLIKNESPYCVFATSFIDMVGKNNDHIIVTTIVLKESSFKLQNQYKIMQSLLESLDCVKIIKTKNEDYNFARWLERTEKIKLSFYDYLHIAVAKRLNMHLITRDNDLIIVAKKYVFVNKPEELIC